MENQTLWNLSFEFVPKKKKNNHLCVLLNLFPSRKKNHLCGHGYMSNGQIRLALEME